MPDSKPSVAVIGGGWYGCHVAYTLKERGFNVTLFEKKIDFRRGEREKSVSPPRRFSLSAFTPDKTTDTERPERVQ